MRKEILTWITILCLAAIAIQSCSKGGGETPVTTPPRDTTSATPPKDTSSTTTPPKDTTATQPPKDTTTQITASVRVINTLDFYELSNYSLGEVDVAFDPFWVHVYLDDPNGNITFQFVPADSTDIAEPIQYDTSQAYVILRYHHDYKGDDTALTVEQARNYDRLVATTTDKATGKIHQDIYVTKQFVAYPHDPILFSVRDFKLADLPKATGARFQQDIQVLKYKLAK